MSRIGQIGRLLAGVLLIWGAQVSAAETNMLTNGSFEQYTCGVMGCSFSDWSMPLSTGTANTEDKIDGEVSLQIYSTNISVNLDNPVYLLDDFFEPGTSFKITLHYKVLQLREGDSLSLDCYWEPSIGGDAEEMKKHDADVLQRSFTDSLSTEWETLEIVTTKPVASSVLRVRMVIPKKAKVLLDAFSVIDESQEDPNEPYISVTPIKVQALSVNLGETADFTTLHVEQANVTGTTTFYLSGYDPSMFKLSATSIGEGESSKDIVVTYAPTQAGTHEAVLNIENLNHTTLFKSVVLKGTCVDPTVHPSITVAPTELPSFEAVVGQDARDTFTVTSTNCQDYVYLRVDHIQGAAFTIDGSMMGKNAKSDFVVRFAPLQPGEYESTVTVYSEGVESIVLRLTGTGIKRDSTNIDWMTSFQWDESKPLKLLNETFDNIDHNKTVVLEGWQNVAAVEQRPWWGFDEAKTSPKRGTGKYAKATAYQYAQASTGDWQMFLVTPALDYKNAEGKIFAFSIMGEYMPDEDNMAALEIYYVDATGEKAYFQDLTESFLIPTTSVDNNVWVTYFLNLAPYAETMADVFHIAFRYIGPNGGAGAVTYYIDDVSWGRTDLPEIIVEPTYIIDSTAVIGVEKILCEVNVTGKNLTNNITLGVAGANYNRFNLSQGTLPANGGKFAVSFAGQEAGVHEAYIVLTSKGAPETYIPMAVLCHEASGVENIPVTGSGRKELREGQLVIIRGEKIYTVLGTQIQ